ncbi:hypothetical protein D3C80_2155730 [compost metagenome]
MPALEVLLVQALVVQYLAPQIGGKLAAQKRADLVAEILQFRIMRHGLGPGQSAAARR